MKMKQNETRSVMIHFKLTPSESRHMEALMDTYNYRSISRFWRSLLNSKRLSALPGASLQEATGKTVVPDAPLVEAFPPVPEPKFDKEALLEYMEASSRFIVEINRIGRNHNQAVTAVNAIQAKAKNSLFVRRELVECGSKLDILIKLESEMNAVLREWEAFSKDKLGYFYSLIHGHQDR